MGRLDRYAIIHPLEGGPDVRVYACRECGVKESRTVLSLISKQCSSREAAPLLKIRISLSIPHLVRVSNVAFRGKRLGVISQYIPEEYSPGALERLRDPERFAWELGCLLRELHRAGLCLGVIQRHQIFVRGDGSWLANFLGPYRLFGDFRGRRFLASSSPDFIRSRTETAAADCYSFGLVLYELFAGHPALTSVIPSDLAHKQQVARPRKPRNVNPDISRRVEQVIMDLLEKRASARAGLDYALSALEPPGLARRPPQLPDGPMAGRGQEMRAFARVLQEYLAEPGFRFVCLCGPSGIGKTRLARELELMARLAGCPSLTVRYLQEGLPMPLTRLVSDLLPAAGKDASHASTARSIGGRLRGPLMLRSEDLHWLDECDMELYKQLQVLQAPVLVLGTAQRRGGGVSWKQLQEWLSLSDGIFWMRLRGLRRRSARAILEFAHPDCTESQVQDLMRSTAGNPLLLMEAIRNGWQSGFSSTRARARQNFLARVADLAEPSRRILHTLALARGAITDGLLAASVGVEEKLLRGVLKELEELDLVFRRGGGSSGESQLSHEFYRSAITGALGAEQRRSIHSSLASSYELEVGRSGNQALLEEVARYWLRCGSRERALVHLSGAVGGLLEAGFPRRAADLLEEAFRSKAVTHHDWDVIEQLMQLLYDCGEYKRLTNLAEEVMNSLGDGDRKGKALLLLFVARVKKLMGKRQAAAEICRQGLRLVGEGDDVFKRQLGTILMIVQAQAGRRVEARRLFEQLKPEIEESRPEGDSIHSACALFLLESEGDVDAARHHALQSVLPLSRGRPLMPGLGRICSLATCLEAKGLLKRARALLNYVLGQARELANPELMSLAALNLSTSLRRLGRIRELEENLDWISRSEILRNRDYRAENHLQRAKYRASRLDLKAAHQEVRRAFGGTSWTVSRARVCAAWILNLRGDPGGALDLLSGSPPSNRLVRGQSLLARAHASAQMERWPAARHAAEEALRIFGFSMLYHRAKGHQQLALLCLAEGDNVSALQHLDSSLEIAGRESYDALLARGFVLRGYSLASLGDPHRGRVWVARGLQVLNRVGLPGLRAEAQGRMGQVLRLLGRKEEARLCFVRALQILREKSLQLGEEDRSGFDRLWIEPLSRELSSLQPSDGDVESRIQIVERFAARLRTCRDVEEVSEAILDAITAGVDCRSATILHPAKHGREVIAAHQGPETGFCGTGTPVEMADDFTLRESLTLTGVGSLSLRVTGGSGGFVESEYDLIKCLVRVAEGQARDWSGRDRSVSQEARESGMELSDGRCLKGQHPLMQRVFELIRKVAPTTATVLISGESGTGKELVARALHEKSGRSKNPWIAVNCAALPAELLESELFGHRKGSFTGAETDRAGLIEAAHTGTLFLDEIASMPVGHQTRLLRVLQERRVRRLGETAERHVDVRFIAASNQSLEKRVACGKFREDLFHRLNVIQIRVPSLRERLSDIPALVHYFLERLAQEHGERKNASQGFLKHLQRLSYPGNVRELRNRLEQAYLLGSGSQLMASDLPEPEAGSSGQPLRDALSRQLFNDLVQGRVDFWEDVRPRFLKRDLSRPEIRRLIALGLESTEGNYRRLVQRFHLPETDYRRFLSFLSHHDCKVDFRPFRIQSPVP